MPEEKKIKPTIEEKAADLLSGEKLKNYLDFYQFLIANKLSKAPSNKDGTALTIKFKNKLFCSFRVSPDSWRLSFFKYFRQEKWYDKIEPYLSDEQKDFICSNINIKPGCKGCDGEKELIIFGKTFNNVCACHSLLLRNPEGKALEYAKELVLIAKKIIAESI